MSVCRSGQSLGSCKCVSVGRVWDRVGVCTCGQSLESSKCVYLWTELGILYVCVTVDRV